MTEDLSKELREALERALQDSAEGRIVSRGSFAEHAEAEEESEEEDGD